MDINPLAENFSLILQYTTDYEYQLQRVTEMFVDTLANIDEKNYLSIDFLKQYREYPKYPVDFKVINNLNLYNLVTIYETSQGDNLEYLLDVITNESILSTKNNFDNIPELVKEDYELQTSFFANITDDYFDPLIYRGLVLDTSRRSYLFKTFTKPVDLENRKSSLLYLYAIYVFLIKNFRYCLKLYENIYFSPSVLTWKNYDFAQSFKLYIKNNQNEITNGIIQFILSYTYKIVNPSKAFLKELEIIIKEQLDKLPAVFEKSLVLKNPIGPNLVQYTSELIYNYLAVKITNSAGDPTFGMVDIDPEIIKKNSLFDRDLFNALKRYEIEMYEEAYSKYSIESIKEYLFLVYYYKLYPKKFLNVLQLVLINYVRNHMIDPQVHQFNLNRLQNELTILIGTINRRPTAGLNFDILNGLLDVVTPSYLNEILDQEWIYQFATRTQIVSYFEEIFNNQNPDFEVWMDETYDRIFTHLIKTVQVEPTYEYYFNQRLLYWYIITYMKRDTFLNKIFNKEELQLDEILRDIINSPNYKINFSIEKMRSRSAQFLEGNILNISNLIENILETSLEKQIHKEHIAYFLN